MGRQDKSSMWILAIDFSSPRKGVCVYPVNNLQAPGSGFQLPLPGAIEVFDGPSTPLVPFRLIDSAIAMAGIKPENVGGIVIGSGPGSYTGIRVAIAIAQGWKIAFGPREIRFFQIPSYEAIIANAAAQGIRGDASVIIDAQQNELYLAKFKITDNGWSETEALHIVPAAMIGKLTQGTIVVGPDSQNWIADGVNVYPSLAYLAYATLKSAPVIDPSNLTPIYLRQPGFKKAPPPRTLPMEL